MITISLCMIVKNEEAILKRCLDSIADLVEEIIIVDTGSKDKTKEIAKQYTSQIYDFEWIDDFSAARNFAFSKATKEYIYSADADEVLDEENRIRFQQLKEALLLEVEIVQMKYTNQLQFGSVYNFDEEYRPKLFKRLRTFQWEEAIHEMVRLEPIIYDSDIKIIHMPSNSHAYRDLQNFNRQVMRGVRLSKRLHNMYAKELFLAGEKEDFQKAKLFFESSAMDVQRSEEEVIEAACVAARAARLDGNIKNFLKYACKVLAGEGCSEICCDLGLYYEEQEDYEEAIIWYYNAVYEVQPILVLKCKQQEPLHGLIRCYQALGIEEQVEQYQLELERIELE